MKKLDVSSIPGKEDKVKAITEYLEEGVKNLFNDAAYRDYLTKMSQVYSYSLNNLLLIFAQKPDATIVGGMKMWNDTFHRRVNKGEKGIAILAPVEKTRWVTAKKVDEDGNTIFDDNGEPIMEKKKVKYFTFRVVYVFDVSQTDGEPMPVVGVKELGGCVQNYDAIMSALVDISGLPVSYEKLDGGVKGYYSRDGRIVLNEGMSETQTLKTMVHELAHSMLHNADVLEPGTKSRSSKEVEAESVAFTVCTYLGLDTSDYSFTYVGTWAGGLDTKVLMESMETIRKCAADIIKKIEETVGCTAADMGVSEEVA